MAAPPRQTIRVRAVEAVQCLDPSKTYGDFRDDLNRHGYAVIKAIPEERAAGYVDEIQTWLEGFGLGYKRDDPSTVREECLPVITPRGMVQGYGAPHESFTWGVRSEPGVVGAFEKVYGTEDLIVSFDAINVSFPNRKDLGPNTAWPHQDQDPDRPGFRCLQGLVNLLPCGDDDGGLMILKGSHKISEEFHKVFANEERIWQWTNEWYGFTEAGIAWLQDRGFEWVKVNAGPGDLIMWDSRCPHYNVSPKGNTPRFVVYTCYAPVSTATQEELLRKKELFENTKGTTHWPQALQIFRDQVVFAPRDGKPDPYNTGKPRALPQLNERGFRLTGIPYIKSSA